MQKPKKKPQRKSQSRSLMAGSGMRTAIAVVSTDGLAVSFIPNKLPDSKYYA